VKTFIQLLRVGFWMLPFQRWLTALGAALCIISLTFKLPFLMPGSTLPLTFLGVAIMVITPLLAGGTFFRMLSAPRSVLLLPHGKGRLLAGMISVAMLATMIWILAYYAAFLRVPPKFRPDFEAYTIMYVLTLSFATQCSIASFVASRGPIWALVVLGAWQLPGIAMKLLGVSDAPKLLAGPVGLATVLVSWTVFGVWYLRTRHIGSLGWKAGAGAPSSGPGAALTLAARAPNTREDAMTRWLLGSSTPLRIGLQWLAGAALLVGVQLLLGHMYESPPRFVNAMLYGTLSLGAIVIGAISYAIAGRSRGLWLNAGRSRLQLHAWSERLMLRVALAIALPLALLGGVAWTCLTPRPALPGIYLLVAMIAPGLGAAWFGLMQLHRRISLDAIGALLLAAGWYYSLVQPLFSGSAQPRWGVVAAQLALAALLREVAYVRWRAADWPRNQHVAPVG
jgi:hypothetical protein